jgi:wyosine [tRNA(Phe)-imidazoG37] synthetase (radical SAM superfamily)
VMTCFSSRSLIREVRDATLMFLSLTGNANADWRKVERPKRTD